MVVYEVEEQSETDNETEGIEVAEEGETSEDKNGEKLSLKE
jgi:hypothetical protein